MQDSAFLTNHRCRRITRIALRSQIREIRLPLVGISGMTVTGLNSCN